MIFIIYIECVPIKLRRMLENLILFLMIKSKFKMVENFCMKHKKEYSKLVILAQHHKRILLKYNGESLLN